MTGDRSRALKFVRKLKRYDLYYLQRKIYDRKAVKEMESLRQAARLAKALGADATRIRELMRDFAEELTPFYRDYVANTSSEIMAVSLELSTFLLAYCELRRPARVLDLGSGFSSFCLRRWAARGAPDAEIWSVDDAPEWLEKTREFLRRHGIPDDRLMTWDGFLAADRGRFDLVLYDLGPFPLRKDSLARVIGFASRPGAIVLDDMHAAEYGLHVKKEFRARRLPCYSIRRYTNDRFGRYAHLAIV